ncbi:hypothetical protein EPN44_15115 [bacterium]|nr:MAG: hypothetical protein EPN44_15115 [bacterium]
MLVLCENCRDREAGIRVTRIADGSARSVDLCAVCAAVAGERGAEHEPHCEGCGRSFDTVARTQLLGCGQCYGAFAERLEPLLAEIQAGCSHGGKIPARRGRRLRLLDAQQRSDA